MTPLELVAVAIVTGIVMTLAYTAYWTHRVRGEVGEGVELATTIAPLIVDATSRGGDVPAELSAAISLSFQKTLTASVVESVAVVDGRIDVVFGNAADDSIAGGRISITPYETADLSVVWVCGNREPGPGLNPLGFANGGRQPVRLPPTIEARYLPASCR